MAHINETLNESWCAIYVLTGVWFNNASPFAFLDGYRSTVQGLLDWFEVDLGLTELFFLQVDLCVACIMYLQVYGSTMDHHSLF